MQGHKLRSDNYRSRKNALALAKERHTWSIALEKVFCGL